MNERYGQMMVEGLVSRNQGRGAVETAKSRKCDRGGEEGSSRRREAVGRDRGWFTGGGWLAQRQVAFFLTSYCAFFCVRLALSVKIRRGKQDFGTFVPDPRR